VVESITLHSQGFGTARFLHAQVGSGPEWWYITGLEGNLSPLEKTLLMVQKQKNLWFEFCDTGTFLQQAHRRQHSSQAHFF